VGGRKESKSHKVKSLRLIELEVTDRVPSAPGATNLMQLLYNSLCRLALTTNRTISEIELSPPVPGAEVFSSPGWSRRRVTSFGQRSSRR